MKRVLMLSILFACASSVMVGCKKKEIIEPLAPGTATVKGKLTAKLDETSLTPVAVPAGTGVTFIISGYDLDNNPDQNFNYDNTVVRATTDANGNYTVSLPARKKSISVEVKYDEFEYDATVLVTNEQGFQVPSTVRKTFKAMSNNVEIVDGIVKVNDKEYYIDGTSSSNDAIIKGRLKGIFADNVGTVADGEVTVNGANYTTTNAITVTGGTGTGLKIDFIDFNSNGAIDNGEWFVNNAGQGYKIDDIVSVTTGNGLARIKITNVIATATSVPANVVLTFTVSDGTSYKVVTNSSGEYTVKVPVFINNSSVTLSMADFEYQSTYFSNTTNTYVNGLKIYGLSNDNLSVEPNDIHEQNYTVVRQN